ncbi:MAG TPA: SCP2 sterol-binding domain-containing protein [Solirubrobacteraceae bacterium]|nr:SCP2 sterol-binding domain-containing protein [Solirubrobacteraceae bacterium]
MKTVAKRSRGRWFADRKAEALAWWVRTASDQRLGSVMRSRRRSVLLWAIFRTIRQRAQPDTRVNAVVEFRIADRRDGGTDRYQLAFTNGRCMTSRHNGRKPALTLSVEPVAFLHLVGGTATPQRLFIAGKLRLHGDLILALALPATLRIPRRRPQAPSRKR